MNYQVVSSLQEILAMHVDDIKPPMLLPVGTYRCFVDGQPKYDQVGANGTDCVDFNLKVVEALPDVDPDQLTNVLNGAALQSQTIRHRLFLTDKSKHRVAAFLVNDLGVSKGKLGMMITEAMGKYVLVRVTHQMAKDGKDTLYLNVASTARA
jgi:hypothetical protein